MTFTKNILTCYLLVITSFLIASCNKNEEPNQGNAIPHSWCEANITVSGSLSGSFKLTDEGYFSSILGDSAYFGSSQKGHPTYTIFVNVDLDGVVDSPIMPPDVLGPIIEFDGFEDHNYVKFRVHGSPDIDYIVQSGGITIILLDWYILEGNIDVVLKNQMEEVINLSGHIYGFHGI